MKVVAAASMWDVCMEKGHKDLEQFERVHRYISDQLFTNFVSDRLQHTVHGGSSSWGSFYLQLVKKATTETCSVHQESWPSSRIVAAGFYIQRMTFNKLKAR